MNELDDTKRIGNKIIGAIETEEESLNDVFLALESCLPSTCHNSVPTAEREFDRRPCRQAGPSYLDRLM
jgi:hypothetical protein